MLKKRGTGKTVVTVSEKHKISLFLMLLLIISGALTGTLLFNAFKESGLINSGFVNHGFIVYNEKLSALQIFKTGITSTGILLSMLLLLGFGAISQPFEFLLLFYRGIALGASISYTYTSHGLQGFFIVLSLILPHALLTSLILSLAAREAVRMSNSFAYYAFSEKTDTGLRSQLKLYLFKFLVLFVMLIISGILRCILTLALSHLFF